MLGSTVLAAGDAGLPIVEGFDGFIKFDVATEAQTPLDQRYLPVAQYLGGVISGDVTRGDPITMMQRQLLKAVVQQSFVGLDPVAVLERGIVQVGVYDCNGEPASDVRVEVQSSGQTLSGVAPFQLAVSRIPIALPPEQALHTDASGLVGYLNVPPGAVDLQAYRQGDTEPFRSVQVGVVAGETSQVPIRPPYLNDADLSRTTPSEP